MSAAGQWDVVIRTPMGDHGVVFTLAIGGDELHGSIQGPKEISELYDGKVNGNALSWRAKVTSPIPMDLQFTALVDGNSISGGAKSPFGTAPFSGRRV